MRGAGRLVVVVTSEAEAVSFHETYGKYGKNSPCVSASVAVAIHHLGTDSCLCGA